MWKFGVAAAVTGIAAFAAVVVVGRGHVEPEPLESGLVVVPQLSWAERAGRLCYDSMDAVRAELAGPGGQETQEARALRIYRETTRIEGTLVERLRELPETPEEARDALALLARQHERDTKTVRRLEEELDRQLILR